MRYGCIAFTALLLSSCIDAPEVGHSERPVINGTPTPAGMFPATGALMADLGGGLEPSCTGTLIAPRAVLTAGHCVDAFFTGGQTPSFTLEADANNAPAASIVAGASHHPHPDFDIQADLPDGVTQWNDIAVLLLAADVPGAEIAILPTPEESEALAPGASLDLVGYGLTSADGFAVGVKHHGNGDLRELGTHELLISEPGQQQNCNGDSGGPALVDLGAGPRIIGVVSRSPDQDPTCDHGGIDTRVDAYLEWIHSLVEVECGGLMGPCETEAEGGGCCSTGRGGELPGALVLVGAVAVLLARRRG